MRPVLFTAFSALALFSILAAGTQNARWQPFTDASLSEDRGDVVQSLRANPRRTSARILLGLSLESEGDFAKAERELLEAARYDRRYLPAWTLANFYFRRNNQQQFWTWASRAAALTYNDYRPLLRLCDYLEPDPAVVLRLLDATPQTERAYLDFLITAGSLARAEVVAQSMLARHDPEDQPRLADLVTREIRAARAQPALDLWNALFIPLDPNRGPVLTNGDLRRPPSGIGFDWTLPTASALHEWSPSALTFRFTGAEPDTLTLLEQSIPVAPSKSYRLSLESKVVNALPSKPVTPARWEIDGEPAIELTATDSWQRFEGVHSSPRTGLASLTLAYRRLPGSLPFQGSVAIRNIRIEVR